MCLRILTTHIFLMKLQTFEFWGGIGIHCWSLDTAAAVFEGCILLDSIMGMPPPEEQWGALSGRRNPNNHHFYPVEEGISQNAASITVSSIMLMNAENGPMMGFLGR